MAALTAICETIDIPVEIGGGIRTDEDIESLLATGVKRVILGTRACEHPEELTRLVEKFGGYSNGPFPEDYELWLRWMANGVMAGKVDEELLAWSDPPDRLSRTDERYSVEAFYKTMLVKYLDQSNAVIALSIIANDHCRKYVFQTVFTHNFVKSRICIK